MDTKTYGTLSSHGYDDPHPKSILGVAISDGDQETVLKVMRGRKAQAEQERIFEAWEQEDFQV